MSLIFFVTGVSSGFGLEIVLVALSNGHKVIGTVRSRSRAADQVKQIESKGGKVLELDVTHAEACDKVWAEAEKLYGHVDVLINNAGMSYLGALEDFTDDDFRAQMDVNVLGPFRLIKASLPGFRKQKSGTIVNVTSIAGVDGLPSCGFYAASKFALEGMSESLAKELEEYKINVLIVEPGQFRTNFLGAYKVNSQKTLKEYSLVEKTFKYFEEMEGKQRGDPVKAAEIIVQAISGQGKAGHLKGKVLRLPLGPDCVARFGTKVDKFKADLEAVREVASVTDIDGWSG